NLGAITDSFGNAIVETNSLAVDPTDNTLYTAGFNEDAPIPTASVGIIGITNNTLLSSVGGGATTLSLNDAVSSPDLQVTPLNGAHLGDYNILATTISADGLTGYALNNNNGTLELYKFLRQPITGTLISFTKLGDVRTAAGSRITDLASLDLDSTGKLYSIG